MIDWIAGLPTWGAWTLVILVLLVWGAICWGIGFARREDLDWARRRRRIDLQLEDDDWLRRHGINPESAEISE